MAPVPLAWYCHDVAFDHAAANEAIGELELLERFVRALAETRGLAAPEARNDWSGRFDDDFAREFPVTQDTLTGVADGISRLVGRIRDGIDAAAAAQSGRERLRSLCAEPDCCQGGR
ncbi:MAG: hypothetical protein ACRDYX_05455 [Egibacteraceae bacterium]